MPVLKTPMEATTHTLGSIRRSAIAASSAFALLAADVCQDALAQSLHPIRNIQIDVSPLRASVGDPTATWVQRELPDQLAQALASRRTAQGDTLVVRIDSVALGSIKDGAAWDNIGGIASIGGVHWPVRATARYHVSAVDQAMFEESNHQRVTRLVQALTYWLVRDL